MGKKSIILRISGAEEGRDRRRDETEIELINRERNAQRQKYIGF